jgi:DNA-binding transcriptional ArsR family regulator
MRFDDKRFEKSLEFLIVATKGGINRGRIIESLLKKELKANQLSKQLKLDYKTVTHHLEKLAKDNIVFQKSPKYGGNYAITFDKLQKECFHKMWQKFGQTNKNKARGE